MCMATTIPSSFSTANSALFRKISIVRSLRVSPSFKTEELGIGHFTGWSSLVGSRGCSIGLNSKLNSTIPRLHPASATSSPFGIKNSLLSTTSSQEKPMDMIICSSSKRRAELHQKTPKRLLQICFVGRETAKHLEMDENTGEFNLRRVNLTDSYLDSSSDSARLLSQVQQTLNTCAQSIESDDFHQSESSVGALVDFLDSVSTAALSDPDSTFANENASAVLAELHRFVSSSFLNQMVIDSLSFELPKAVVKFVGVSDECCKVVDDIIDRFITVCSPRDMLSVLCDALDSLHKVFKAPTYFIPLLGGISKVFLCIQRRHFEQAKEAFPIILSVLKAASLESRDEDKESSRELVSRSIDVATSIQTVCQKSIVKRKEELHALLGLYVLQVMACITSNLADRVSSCIPSVIRLSQFFPVCGLSYLGLITGRDVDSISGIALGEDDDGIMGCFSFVKHGASLAVIWGHVSNEVAKTAGEDFTSVKDKLRSNQIERWQAIGMLRYVLSALDQPWELKGHAIDLLLSIMDGSVPQKCDENHIECSSYMPGLFTDLQAVEKVIIYASDTVLRKKAFAAMKRVISDIPNCQRFDVLKALITNSSSPSMVAILMDIVKAEIHMESCQKVPSTSEEVKKVETKVDQSSLFWSSNAMELVEFILKPPRGGPPSLPEESEAVLSALNLYRFVLIKESTGKTNYTGVLSENNLQKAYTEWFLPLRTMASAIEAENRKDYDEFAGDTICALNPVQLVLYRCIELVEEKLKQCK